MNHGRRFPYLPTLHTPGAPDADLLARWVAHRDEAAFELLVRRHAPVVLAACRRLLADPNDADDAFQAVFLVLARKAASVARGEALGAWLHRVACRTALRVRADRARRAERQQESDAVEQLPAPAPADPAWSELLRVLDEEIERLPARHRVVFVLCCLEGKTGEEVGRIVGCPPGTVSSRLTRARERLRHRLARRGFAPAPPVLAALTAGALGAPVPNALVESVVRAAPSFSSAPGSGPSTRATTIAEGVLRTMLVQKLKLVSGLLVAGLLAVGAALAGSGSDRAGTPEPPRPVPNPAAEKGPPDEKRPPAAPVVRLVKPQPGGLDRITSQQCVAEAGREARLFPVAAGTLTRVEARLGDRVKAGQLLAEIDAPGLTLDERLAAVAVEQAQGLVKEAEARVAAAKAEADAARGVVRLRQAEAAAAKANAELKKRSFDRIKATAGQGAVAQAEVNQAEEKFREAEGLAAVAAVGADNAKAELSVKESKLGLAEAGVVTAKANVEIARLGLEKARLAVARTRIAAPFDGIVAESNAAPGQVVPAPGERADAVPLFTVMRADTLRLVVWVPDRDVARVEPGLAAEVAFEALPGVRATGRVARVGLAVEPPHRAVRAEIDLPNPKGEVRPGMAGSVALNLGKGPADALRVPSGALASATATEPTDSTAAVYVYKDGKARLMPVRLGHRVGKEVEVLSGLTAEDLVVADPKGLVPKAEVAVEVEKPAPPK